MRVLFVLLLLVSQILGKLEMVIEIFRHGARSPVASKPKYLFGSEWERGNGQITDSGERQQYLLGLKRRKQYVENQTLLPDRYQHGSIYAESTGFNRTQMSANAHLYGMYPPEFREQYEVEVDDKKLQFMQPIPVHKRTMGAGLLDGHSRNTCHARAVIEDKSVQEANEEFANYAFIQDMINELNEKLKLEGDDKVKVFTELNDFADAYYAIDFELKDHTVELSDEFKSNMLHYFYLFHFHMLFRDDYGLRIANHNFFSLLNILISHKMGIKSPTPETTTTLTVPKDAKYYLFSAHDTTLVSFMAGIGHK